MKNKKSPHHEKKKSMTLAKSLAAGTGAGMIVWTLLVFAASYILAGLDEPEGFIIPAVLVLAATASATSGAVSSKLSGVYSLLPGAVTGAILFVCVFLLSLACADTSYESSVLLKVMICTVFFIFSLLGAKLAIPSKKRERRSRR